MKRRYQIAPGIRSDGPSDEEIARYRDPKKLFYNYHKAVLRPKVPIYKDPKAFLVLLLIVLLAYFIAEVVDKDQGSMDHTVPSALDRSPEGE
ncbi:MAG: hypothetical protein KDC00_08600 [Flavobacteriales bacterium]|nr:hypothetical protein [Flavobacteriales bacterium]